MNWASRTSIFRSGTLCIPQQLDAVELEGDVVHDKPLAVMVKVEVDASNLIRLDPVSHLDVVLLIPGLAFALEVTHSLVLLYRIVRGRHEIGRASCRERV